MQYRTVGVIWLVWLIYWFVASGSSKPAQWIETRASRAAHVVPLVIAAALVGLPQFVPHVLHGRLLPWSPARSWAGVAVLAAGLAFSVWARLHIGRNWSGMVTVKEGHELVRTGPYRYVRHPIYTGIILGFLGTTIAIAQWRSLIALVLAVASLVRKLRLEERRMSETFPEYEAYRRETAALFPFIY
jgi:protein-S-isoprenylcysteine O-methyltransferase Ste14